MDETIQDKLLRHLNNVVYGDYCDLSDYFHEYYHDHRQEFLDEVRLTLQDLTVVKKHIRFKDNTTTYELLGMDATFGSNGRELATFAVLDNVYHKPLKAVITHGGREYVKQLDKEREASERQKILDKVVGYDFLTKKFIYKWRFLPYGLSAAALFVAIFAYFKPSKEQSTTPTTNNAAADRP